MSQISFYIGLALVWLAGLSGNLGNAIVIFSLLLKTALLPLSISSQTQMNKMRKMQPYLEKLKSKHKGDAKAFQQAQVELMKEHQVNPVGGCIPQLVQFGILIVLYQVFIGVFNTGEINGQLFDTAYLWFDLRHSDPTYLLPVATGVLQFILSLMMTNPTPPPTEEVVRKKKGKKSALTIGMEQPKSKEDMADFSTSMQKQMIFVLPVMTTLSFIMLKLPSGLALYWTVTSIFSIVQQYYLSGPGALIEYWDKAKLFVVSRIK
ncbi:membrane protein insertase YidC [Candidatus Woesebacteria bacterium]|nr:membrane protein insertase YidC [Candidatus Woesebacteria bacterium]